MRSNKSSKTKLPTVFGKPPEINKSGNKKSSKHQNVATGNFPLYGPSNFNSFGTNFAPTNVNPFGGPFGPQAPNFGTQAPNFGNPFGGQPPNFGAPFGGQPPNFGAPFRGQPPNFGTANINPFGGQPPNFGAVNINPFGSQAPNFGNPFGGQAPNFGNTFGFNPQPPTSTNDKEETYNDMLLQDLNLTSSILTDDESSVESFLSDDEKPSTSYQPPPKIIPIIVQEASKAKIVTKPNIKTKTAFNKSVTNNTSTVIKTAAKTVASTPTAAAAKTVASTPTAAAAKTVASTPTAAAAKTVASTPTAAAVTSASTAAAAKTVASTPTAAAAKTVASTPTVAAAKTVASTPTVAAVTSASTAAAVTSAATAAAVTSAATTAGPGYIRIENFENVFARIRYMNIVNSYLKRKHAVLPNCDLTAVKTIAQTDKFKMYHVKFDSFYFGCKQTRFKPQKIDFFKDLTGWDNWPIDQKTKPSEVMVQRILNDVLYKKETQNLLLSAGVEYLCAACDAEYICYNFFTETVDRVLTAAFLTTMTVEEKESVLVQLLCTLAVLHCKYGIIHSAIKLENIALKKVIVRSNYFKYSIGDRSFYVKNTGYIPLLCNFDLAYSVHPDYGSSEYYGIRNVIVEETGLKAGWGTRAGREYRQNPLKLSKKVTFDMTGKFLALEPNMTKILWMDGREGTFNGVYEQNKEKIDLKDLRKHPAEDFFQDVDALLKIFAPYKRLKMGNNKNKILYGLNGLRYIFADLTAAYLFPEIGDYGLYEHEYVYDF